MKARALAWAAVLASLVSTGRAAAQPKTVEVCLAEFEEAQLKQKRGKLTAAFELYDACTKDCPSAVRSDCAQRLDALERSIPTAAIVVRDSREKDIPAKLTLDGKAWAAPPGRAGNVDPGERLIGWEAVDGRGAGQAKVVFHEGEKSRLVVLNYLDPVPVGADAASRPLAADSSDRTAWPWIIGGTGVLFVIGGVVMTVVSSGQSDDAEKLNSLVLSSSPDVRYVYEDAVASRRAAADANRNIAIAGYVAGGSLLVVAVAWYLLEGRARPPSGLRPTLSPGYAGCAWETRF